MVFPSNNLPSDAKYWVREVEKKIVNLENSLSSSDINNTTRDSQLQVTASQALIAAQSAETAVQGLLGLGTDGSEYGIHGGNIVADTITANEISSDYVYAGTISANNITTGTIDAADFRTSSNSYGIRISNSTDAISFTNGSGTGIAHLVPWNNGGILWHYGTSPNKNATSFPLLHLGNSSEGIEADSGSARMNVSGSASLRGSTVTLGGYTSGAASIELMGTLYVSSSASLVNRFVGTTNSDNQLESAQGFRVASGGSLNVADGAEFKYDMPRLTGTTYPVYFDIGTKVVYRLSSSARYKTEIKNADINYDAFLSIPIRTFKNSKQVEEFGSENTEVTYGYIAEEVHDSGLTQFVIYENDENGDPRPESVNYMSMAIASHGLLSIQNQKLIELEARLQLLEGN